MPSLVFGEVVIELPQLQDPFASPPDSSGTPTASLPEQIASGVDVKKVIEPLLAEVVETLQQSMVEVSQLTDTSILNQITAIPTTITNNVSSAVADKVGAITTGVDAALGGLKTAVTEATEGVTASVNGEIAKATTELEKIVGDLIGGIPRALDDATAAARGPYIEALLYLLELVTKEPGAPSVHQRPRLPDGVAIFEVLDALLDLVEEYLEWHSSAERPRFAGHLAGFLDNIYALPGHAARVVVGVNFPAPSAGAFVAEVPGPILFALARGLEALDGRTPEGEKPGWLKQSAALRRQAAVIPSLRALEDGLCDDILDPDKDLYRGLKEAKRTLTVAKPTVDLIINVLPRDQSVDVDILGEGGGTELMAHPMRTPFVAAKWALALLDGACDLTLDFYADCQARQQAKDDKRAAAEEARFRQEQASFRQEQATFRQEQATFRQEQATFRQEHAEFREEVLARLPARGRRH